MSRLKSYSSNPTLKGYIQGAAKQAIPPIQEFLAPTVPVATMTGQYKEWDAKTGLIIPDTKRGLMGRATQVGFDLKDKPFNLTPHALDFPVDKLVTEDGDILNVLMEGADITAQLAALSSLSLTSKLALATLGAGVDFNIAANGADPVKAINTAVRTVILGTKGMSPMMEIRILWGFDAYKLFMENKEVRGRFTAGKKESSELNLESIQNVFVRPVKQMINEVVYDANTNKDAPNVQFLLGSSVIIFAASAQPTRYDTSFMKTLRLRGGFMAPRFYESDDGRVDFAAYDWNEEIIAANAGAGYRLNFTEA